jgi:hypothetical protein
MKHKLRLLVTVLGLMLGVIGLFALFSKSSREIPLQIC